MGPCSLILTIIVTVPKFRGRTLVMNQSSEIAPLPSVLQDAAISRRALYQQIRAL